MSRRPTSEVINAAIAATSDEIGLQLDEATRWLNDIVEQTYEQSRKKKKYCEICSTSCCSHALHHIAGEKHDDRTITVCKACHDELSARQNLRDRRWGDPNQSDAIKQGFFLWGLFDILELKRDVTGNSMYTEIASRLRTNIWHVIRNG